MDSLEQKINQVLSDPDSMAQILSLAQSLGVAPPGQGAGQTPEPEQTPAPPPIDGAALAGLMQQVGSMGQREQALFEALKPFVSPARRSKIDRALQISRFSKMASLALKNFDKKP